jgi:hypothetical protein
VYTCTTENKKQRLTSRSHSNTTHVTLMERMPVIVPMVNDFFDAKPKKQFGHGHVISR